MNLRNRLIWIAALTVAFAGVQLVASRRKAEQELREDVKDKLMPLLDECARQAHERSPGLRGRLTLQVSVVPDGKLDSIVERVQLAATSEVREPQLVECMRQSAKRLPLKRPVPSAQQLELTLPIEPSPLPAEPR